MELKKAMKAGRWEMLDVSREADRQYDMVIMRTWARKDRLNETAATTKIESQTIGTIVISPMTLALVMHLAKAAETSIGSLTVAISKTNPTNKIISIMAAMQDESRISAITRMKTDISINLNMGATL